MFKVLADLNCRPELLEATTQAIVPQFLEADGIKKFYHVEIMPPD